MTHGIDTCFLIAVEVLENPNHAVARKALARILGVGDRLALAPQVLAEFIHIVSDPKRFSQPLTMDEACARAEYWWTARDVDQVFPTDAAVRQFTQWLGLHRLGRNRLLDTLLAATYRSASIGSLLTFNPRDFTVLGGFSMSAVAP